ncbi:MAG: exosortase/archaeosortase family protein [Candidatus Nanohaloarchaea archaeon]
MREKIEQAWKTFREETEKQPRNVKMAKFVGKLLAMGILFHLILFLDPETTFPQEILADMSSWFLNLLGYSFETRGVTVFGLEGAYIITRDCLGWKSVAVFSALVIATPEIKRKTRKLFFGTLMILVANFVRVTSTVILAEEKIISFDLIHTLLWRWGMTFLVLAIWYALLAESDLNQGLRVSLNRRL